VQWILLIIAVESWQDAFFRIRGGSDPFSTPFDMAISSTWAYNLALSFIQPSSCLVEILVPILSSLSVVPSPAPLKYANTTT
jgi:hypothetical protein